MEWNHFMNIVEKKMGPENLSEGILPLTSSPSTIQTALYDLQGRLSPLKKGIYIENGRKRVVSR